MGKNQHSKDRLFVTRTEHVSLYGGRRGRGPSSSDTASRSLSRTSLPVDWCALTQKPCQTPVMSPDGTIFEVTAIVPWFGKHGERHPISGEKLCRNDLISVNFDRDDEGELRCPVLRKRLTKGGRVVCIKKTGNVFSWEAVETLNLKQKFMCDLLTGEKIRKDDIVEISRVKISQISIPGSGRRTSMDQRDKEGRHNMRRGASNVKLNATALRILEKVGKDDLGFRKIAIPDGVAGKRAGESIDSERDTKRKRAN